jgi:hypothetical protein
MFPGHEFRGGSRAVRTWSHFSVSRQFAFTRLSPKLARLDIKRGRELEGDGTGGSQLSDSPIELRGFLRMIGIRIFQQNFDGLSQLSNGRHRIPFLLVDVSQEFEKGYTAGSRSEILAQQRFGQPVILSPDRFVR